MQILEIICPVILSLIADFILIRIRKNRKLMLSVLSRLTQIRLQKAARKARITRLRYQQKNLYLKKKQVRSNTIYSCRKLKIQTLFHMQKSIITDFYKTDVKKIYHLITFISTYLFFYFLSNILFKIETKVEIIVILSLLLFTLLIRQILFFYRVCNGFYGTNYEEAKEFTNYLIQIKTTDNNNSNKGTPLFNDDKKNVLVIKEQTEY